MHAVIYKLKDIVFNYLPRQLVNNIYAVVTEFKLYVKIRTHNFYLILGVVFKHMFCHQPLAAPQSTFATMAGPPEKLPR